MKTKILAVILLLALVAACTPTGPSNEPTPDLIATIVASTMQAVTPLAPPPTSMVITVPDSVTMNGVAVAFKNVSMSIPNGFANGARGEVVPRAEGSSVAPWDIGPEYTVITLDGYVLGQRFHEPKIYVYPVEEFAAMNEGAATVIEQLRTVLGDNSPVFPDKLPHLPIFNAEQLFHVQTKKLDFGSGEGIRYLTMYSQAFMPVNNNELFYTFQGLTSDGKYYVAVQLPISTPLLDSMTQPNFTDPGFTGDQYVTYLDGVTKTLNSLAPAFFSPTLEVYDQLVLSIVVTP